MVIRPKNQWLKSVQSKLVHPTSPTSPTSLVQERPKKKTGSLKNLFII